MGNIFFTIFNFIALIDAIIWNHTEIKIKPLNKNYDKVHIIKT